MPSLDPKMLADLRALQTKEAPRFLAELIDLYLAESAKQLETLRAAFDAKDARGLELAAHTMKGMSGNLAATQVSALFAELQRAARAADWPKASALLPRLEADHAAALEELRAERER